MFRERFGYSYEYDDDGNVTKSIGPDGNTTSYTYGNGNSDVTKMTLPGEQEYAYTYNTKRQLTDSLSPAGVETSYAYDSYGNVTNTTVGYSDMTTAGIQSDTAYTSDGNMTASVTSADRNTVTYSNNTEKSLVNSVTDPKGNVTSYTYDTMRRQTVVTQGTSTLNYVYADDRLKTITHSGATNTTYTFNYTDAGLTDSVVVGSGDGAYTLVENTYSPQLWLLTSQSYGNGNVWYYTYNDYYDVESRYTVTSGTSGVEFRYVYNSEGALIRIEQYDATITDGTVTARMLTATESYTYDNSDRMTTLTGKDASGAVLYEYAWDYDKNSNVVTQTQTIGGNTYSYSYTYNDDQQATGVTYGNTTQAITYDGYGRVTSATVSDNGTNRLTTGYTYRTVVEDDKTYDTVQVSTMTNNYGGADHGLTYTYDANGNILTVSDGTYTTTYSYDSLNQLTAEYNEVAGKSWVYTYDTGGNILTKTEYPNATATGEGSVITYGYTDANWGDLLTAYNGNAITYDGLGNPLTMNGWTYSWQGGRQLAGMTNGTTTLSFAYNDSGLRTSKTVGSATHTYTYQGSTLIADVTATDALYFHYDQNGSILGFAYDDGTTSAEYYYVKNLQGDILGILDANGNEVASYSYDAWGNILSVSGSNSTLANRNPIRYRGYYYDTETELYYLQSRYYDPEIGRFINADSYASTGNGIIGHNTFAYCNNNPVSSLDPTGHSPKSWIKDFVGNVLDPCVDKVKQVWASIIPGTVTVGEATSVAAAAYLGFSRGIAMDREGNIGWALTGTGGGGTPSISGGVFVTTTNAPNIDYLEGVSSEIGGAFRFVGYEKVFMPSEDAPNGYYHGNTVFAGPEMGVSPIEFHGTLSYTTVTGKANIFAPYDVFSTIIKEW